MNDDVCDCGCQLDYGDFVEHKLNTNVIGMVVGRSGSILHVRLSPSLAMANYHDCELRLAEGDEYEPPTGARSDGGGGDNVVDFTKARELRKDTPTKGVA